MLSSSDWKSHPFALGVATMGGVGLVPIAPGTAGSLLPIALMWFFPVAWEWLWHGLVSVVAIGLWSITRIQRFGLDAGAAKQHDPAWTIIDEVAGQLSTCCILASFHRLDHLVLMCSFLAFRVCDILKPWPVGWIDRRLSVRPRWQGVSVMLDDLAAGVLAALILLALFRWGPL